MKFERDSLVAIALFSGGSIMVPSIVEAQEGGFVLEEIIVTAQKRAQSLQDVPISVATISGEKINNLGIQGLEELSIYTPNVTINQGMASPNMFIRGIGSGTNSGFEQSVGLYVDGIYVGRSALANTPFIFDLERVEILKGPQGILFGKNTIGGAINVTSARPTDEFEGSTEIIFEPEHGEKVFSAVVSGPLTPSLSGRLAGRHSQMDGWIDNVGTGQQGPDNDEDFIRTSLFWEDGDSLDIQTKYEYGDFKRNAPAIEIIAAPSNTTNDAGVAVWPDAQLDGRSNTNFPAFNNSRTETFALTINKTLGENTLTTISGYSAYDQQWNEDADYSPVSALHRSTQESFEQYSQEIRLASPEGERGSWIVGGYWQSGDLTVDRENVELDYSQMGIANLAVLPAVLNNGQSFIEYDQESESWALFGQSTWSLSETVRVTLGLRYTEEEKQLDKRSYVTVDAGVGVMTPLGIIAYADNSASPPGTAVVVQDLFTHDFKGLQRDEEKFTWSFNTQWDITDDVMSYIAVSTGFKGGGFDESYIGSGDSIRLIGISSAADLFNSDHVADSNNVVATFAGNGSSSLKYEEETVLSYELGAKMTLAGGVADLNIAIFRSEFDNMQVSSLIGDAFRVSNAGESISQGVEVDGRWRLTESLTIGGSLAYLDAFYDEFENATCTVSQAQLVTGECFQDLQGETLLFSPDWSANINVSHVMDFGDELELLTALDVNYADEFYSALDLDANTQHDAVTKVNLRVALSHLNKGWSLALIGKNLTDETTSVWNNDVALNGVGAYFGVIERPRSVALQGKYIF